MGWVRQGHWGLRGCTCSAGEVLGPVGGLSFPVCKVRSWQDYYEISAEHNTLTLSLVRDSPRDPGGGPVSFPADSLGVPPSQVLLHELGLDEPLVTPLRERFLQPLMALLYPDCGGGWLDSHRAFVVKYALGQDRELGCHYDNAELTLNVALGKTFTGGALYFGGLFQVSVCNQGGRAWGSQECPGLSPAVCRRRQPWPGPWKWSMWWARASCTGAASCMGPGPWAQVSAGTSSSGFGPLLCATAYAPCAAANPTWWTTTRASVMASPARSPPLWMCAC